MYLVEVWKSVEPDSSGVDHRDAARARFMGMLKVDEAVSNALRGQYGREGYDFRPREYPLLDFQL